jgi:hypothetical protein
MKTMTSAAIVLSFAATGSAEAAGMSGDEIRQAVSGSVVEIDTPLGTPIPVAYLTSGGLAGNAGDLGSYLGAASDKGRWWLEGDKLCHKWRTWFSGETQCLSLRREGDRIHWQNQAGTSGTARIAKRLVAEESRPPAGATLAAASRLGGPPPAVSEAPPAAAAKVASPAKSKKTAPATTDAAQKPARRPGARAEPSTPAADTATALHRVANVGSGDVLNVRAGPSPDEGVRATLQPDQKGIRISGACQERWCPIKHRDVSGWVNVAFLAPEQPETKTRPRWPVGGMVDAPGAPRSCLSAAARELLQKIERRFGPMKVVSTCRPGAVIAGTGRPSRHSSGNAVDFDAGSRKAEVVAWLAANHKAGGTMTYRDMDHIHVDIGRHFVSLADGSRRMATRRTPSDWDADRMGLTGRWR